MISRTWRRTCIWYTELLGFAPIHTCDLINVLHHFPYIVDFRSAVWLPYEHQSVANADTRSAPIFWVARVFFPMAPSQDGERTVFITKVRRCEGEAHNLK